MATTISPGDIVEEADLLSKLHLHEPWLQSIDAILLLGGGLPLSPTEPPPYVRRRCDVVARILSEIERTKKDVDGDDDDDDDDRRHRPAALCLSAGTAHLPQYVLPSTGLPLWESTASAACLLRHPHHPVPERRVYAETTSYDTLSNAFFSRTNFADVVGWRRLLVVTSEFHVGRTKAIFDWIYGVPTSSTTTSSEEGSESKSARHPSPYELYYLSTKNEGLSDEALASRAAHERRGEENVRTNLAGKYGGSLEDVWEFLTTEHDFYAADRLARTAAGDARGVQRGAADDALEMSYGRAASHPGGDARMAGYRNGSVVLSVGALLAVVCSAAVFGACLAWGLGGRGRPRPSPRKSR